MPRNSRLRAALTLFLPAALMVIGALAGWGLDNIPGFFSNSARTALVAVMLAVVIAGSALRIEFNPFRTGTRHGRRWPILAGIFSAPLMWVIAAWCDRRGILAFPASPILRWIGVVLFTLGESIRLAALDALGRQYSAFLTVQEDHQLVRTGIYRHTRHPFYLGGLINIPGMLLVLRSPLSILVFIASVLFVVNRIRREEQLLSNEFPNAYPSYQRASWRLLPYIY